MKFKNLLIAFYFVCIATSGFTQDENKTVTLTVNGTGVSKEQATQNALRSAIEQAFGTFISSKTEILNDDLVIDQITSVSNGNIQSYQVLSEVEVSSGYAVSLNTVVSISKLTSFVESKGFEAELKGGLFAFNMKLQRLNEENEYKAVSNLAEIVAEISNKAFDYKINTSEPALVPIRLDRIEVSDFQWYLINSIISVYANDNFYVLEDMINKTLSSLSMKEEEVQEYKKVNKQVYQVNKFYLRNKMSIELMYNILLNLRSSILNFTISNSVFNYHILDNPYCISYIKDAGFRLFRLFEEGKYNFDSDKNGSVIYPGGFSSDNVGYTGEQTMKNLGLSDERTFQLILSSDVDTIGKPLPSYNLSLGKGEGFRGAILGYGELRPYYNYRRYDGGALTISFPDRSTELMRIHFRDVLTEDQLAKVTGYKVKSAYPTFNADLVTYEWDWTDRENPKLVTTPTVKKYTGVYKYKDEFSKRYILTFVN